MFTTGYFTHGSHFSEHKRHSRASSHKKSADLQIDCQNRQLLRLIGPLKNESPKEVKKQQATRSKCLAAGLSSKQEVIIHWSESALVA